MYRHLDYSHVSTIRFYFRLEKMAARLNAFVQNFLQGSVGKHLKAAGHIFEFCTEQKISQDTPCIAYKMPAQWSLRKFAALTEAAAENTVIAFGHSIKKLWDL